MAHMLRRTFTIITLCLSLILGVANEATAQDAVPSKYELSSAYPNPFTSQTAFELSVEEPQRVQVAVFNMLGQRVAVLHDGALPTGERTFVFRSRNLPSGIYLLRVKAESFTASRQVTLLK